jgi:hypothetical protein
MAGFGAAFIFESITWPAGTAAIRAASLNHEIGNNAVELKVVIKAVCSQINEISHCDGRNLGIKPYLDITLAGVDYCPYCVARRASLFIHVYISWKYFETFLNGLRSSYLRPRDGLSLKPDRAISALLTP